MNIESFDQNNWTGRIDKEDGKLGLRIHQIVKEFKGEDHAKVIFGFCSEEGVSRNKGRLGAKEAPNTIRKMLANLPVHFNDQTIYDSGNINVDADLEEARKFQEEKIFDLLSKNNLPIVLGGGHETALGNFLGFVKKYPINSLVINLDAHFDLRLPNPNSSSGTPFYEMSQFAKDNNISFNYLVLGLQELGNTKALFNRAEDLKVNYILADEIHANFNRILDDLKQVIAQFDAIYLSLDMDVFDVAYAPGVSATTINGLTPFQIKYLLKLLKKSRKVKVFDIVETNPSFDQDFQTSKLAAQMIYEFLRD